MAAARQKEMKLSSTVVATNTLTVGRWGLPEMGRASARIFNKALGLRSADMVDGQTYPEKEREPPQEPKPPNTSRNRCHRFRKGPNLGNLALDNQNRQSS